MFLWPSKPRSINDPDSFLSVCDQKQWSVQVKKNGSRAIVWIDAEGKVTIYDRRFTTLTISLEEDWSPLAEVFGPETLLDGELIGRKQGEISNRLYLWDVPVLNGKDLTKKSYQERYDILNRLLDPKSKDHWNMLNSINSSGIVATFSDPSWIFMTIQHNGIEGISVGIAKLFPANEWRKLIESLDYKSSTSEDEGLVFKHVTCNMSWDRVKTREITDQVKYLLKYHK